MELFPAFSNKFLTHVSAFVAELKFQGIMNAVKRTVKWLRQQT